MPAGGDKETLATADALAEELDDSDLSELAKITRGWEAYEDDPIHTLKEKV